MLQHIGRVATPKFVPRNFLGCLQTTLIMGEGNWSQNLCEVLNNKMNEKQKGVSLNSLFLMIGICLMILWLIGLLLNHFDPQKNEVWKLSTDIMDFYQ